MASVFPHHDDILTSFLKKELREALDEEITESEDGAAKTAAKVVKELFFDEKEKIYKQY